MTTKFDVGDEVFVTAKVVSMEITSSGCVNCYVRIKPCGGQFIYKFDESDLRSKKKRQDTENEK